MGLMLAAGVSLYWPSLPPGWLYREEAPTVTYMMVFVPPPSPVYLTCPAGQGSALKPYMGNTQPVQALGFGELAIKLMKERK